MPVVVYCPKGHAWLFTIMTGNYYDTDKNIKAAKDWAEAWHYPDCDRDKEDHMIIDCLDPFEMDGM